MPRQVQDHYFRQARRDGYASRAAYKLLEIDDRKSILRRGDRVLDCGAAPGSWLQVAAQRVKAGSGTGRVVGIDLQPIHLAPMPPGVVALQDDALEADVAGLLGAAGLPVTARFDVVLSDMAPATSGDQSIDHHGSMRLCHGVLGRTAALLRPGGTLVMKAFEGEAYPDLLEAARGSFDTVKGYKPKASRDESREMFVIARGFRQPPVAGAAERSAGAPAPPRPRPSPGWGR